MTQIQTQAQRDAIDAHRGHQVRNPYPYLTQPEHHLEWQVAFDEKLKDLARLIVEARG